MGGASHPSDTSHIAVIGMAGRFPGARTIDEFWKNLCAGVESVRFFTDEELLAAGERPDLILDPDYVKAWPSLDDIDQFDAGFFGMSARDAAVMDPQHRIFLEIAWEALENSGYEPGSVPGAVGVFAACGMNSYMMNHLVTNAEVMETVGEWLVRHTGNDMNFLATRVAYQMNFKGPSMNVQTACSSALVAIHLSCQHLLSGECDMALAGASTLTLPQDRGYRFKQGEILSSDGHCRPFDARSRGTLFGSGAGCVVLRRLDDALADGDSVLAVIRGSAVNNDGSQKVGYLAPSVDGQVRVVAEALAISGVDPRTISFVEAHGTGTSVGDPIEVAALTQAYRGRTDASGFCALGSVKANIGHLGEAAGIASFIKTVLALHHRQLPPTINFETPNPELDLPNSPFFVNDALRTWTKPSPLRAGVTALGAGGTNVHVVLEEAPPSPPSETTREPQLLVLSARSPEAVDRAAIRLADHIEQDPALHLADAAYTLQLGRKFFAHRRAFVATDRMTAMVALRRGPAKSATMPVNLRKVPAVVFMFPGGGAQYAGMGRGLYDAEPAYRTAFDECMAALPTEISSRLRLLVFAAEAELGEATVELSRPRSALPALFATEYATAHLLSSWGVEARAFIGHSMGEYVAACLSGVLTLADALALVCTRAALFETLPEGGMLSVELPESDLRPLLGPELSIAAINAPNLCVASGPMTAIEVLERRLAERNVETTRVPISVAAHSAMLGPILSEFERACRKVRFSAPKVPIVSNLTGTFMTAEEATDPAYWVRHLRGTVRFADGVARLVADGENILVEVGPGRTLSSLARQHPSSPTALPSLRHPREAASDVAFLLGALGHIWQAGAPVDFAKLHGSARRQRVALPSYPFERQRHWIEPGIRETAPRSSPALSKRANLTDWFHVPSWRRSVTPEPMPSVRPWLVFADEAGLWQRIASRRTAPTLIVVPGERFAKLADDRYMLRPSARGDYDALVEDLLSNQRLPEQIVHMWAVTPEKRSWFYALHRGDELRDFEQAVGLYFHSLLFLVQALAEHDPALVLSVVSTQLQQVGSETGIEPAKALLLGPTRVISREFPQIHARSIDTQLGSREPSELDRAAEPLLRELLAPPTDRTIALRGVDRWLQHFDALPLEPSKSVIPPLREGSTVLITGGLGGIGLELALHLVETARVKLVLVGRTALPPREEWSSFIARHTENDPIAHRLRKLTAIEAAGGECLPLAADVTDLESMQAVLSAARRRFGAIDCIVHAAGVIEDGLISLKTSETASAVIAAKAKGALVLEQVFQKEKLQLFVAFSSVSSVLGLPGQVDYTAANAFLDAFVQRLGARTKVRAISVGWNAWQELGMAVSLAERSGAAGPADRGRSAGHPCLDRIAFETESEHLFATSFSLTKHWLLSEHVVRGGEAVLPGTGYLELARAAVELISGPGPIELRDITFLSPFAVRSGEVRELRLRIEHNGQRGFPFAFFSDTETEPHVTGTAYPVEKSGALPEHALPTEPCVREVEVGGWLDQPFVVFGPRWANIERISYGDGEAVVRLALPEEFVSDLGDFKLHPGLLDMATGAAQALIAGFDPAKDFYVPFAYSRVTVFRPLPRKIWSHIRYRSSGSPDLAVFDVTVHDSNGDVVVDIAGFTMKRIVNAQAMASRARASSAEPRDGPGAFRLESGASRLQTIIRNGILPKEGLEAFDRLMASGLAGPVFASSIDLNAWLAQVELDARAPSAIALAGSAVAISGAGRPSLGTPFASPRNELEANLARMWTELLGVSDVGIYDDFFELGGQSLVAVRLFSKIRKHYRVDLPLSTLFDAPTIAQVAEIIAAETGLVLDTVARPHDDVAKTTEIQSEPAMAELSAQPLPVRKKTRWHSLVAIQSTGNQPPFYCVSGMGGTLSNLRRLALLMGEARPFYGFQPPGADDPNELLYTVEELAAHYIREMRLVHSGGPRFLGGYSGGGVAAFEMARQLTADGETVAFVGFIDSFSPDMPHRPLVDRAKIHLQRVRDQGPVYVARTLQRRFDYQRWLLERRLARPLGKLFPQKYRYESIEDSWITAEKHYRPTPWNGRATLFRAREESAVSLWTAVEVDSQHGWGRYLIDGVDVQICPGNHRTMCEEPNVRVLAAKLSQAIDSAAQVIRTRPAATSRNELGRTSPGTPRPQLNIA